MHRELARPNLEELERWQGSYVQGNRQKGMRTTAKQSLPSRIPSPNDLNVLSLATHCKGSCLTKPTPHHTVSARRTRGRVENHSSPDRQQAPVSETEGGATSKPPARAHAAPTSGPTRATRDIVRAAIGRLRSCTCERGFLTDRPSECQAFGHSAPAVKLVF